jgi:hypothetical protein
LFDVARRHDISPSQLLGWLKRRHLIADCERLGNRHPALRTFIVAALNSSGGDPIMKLTGRDHHHLWAVLEAALWVQAAPLVSHQRLDAVAARRRRPVTGNSSTKFT